MFIFAIELYHCASLTSTVPIPARSISTLISYAAKASEIGAIIRAEDGVKVACDAIEQQLKAA